MLDGPDHPKHHDRPQIEVAASDQRGAASVAALIGIAAAVLLAGVFFLSVWTKALDPAGFAEQVVRDGLMAQGFAFPAAILVVGIEAALAFGLLATRRPTILGLASLMMLAFLGLSAYQFFIPPADPSSCGCFGNLIQQSPGQHVATNLLFTLFAGLAWLGLDKRNPFPAWRWWVPVGGFAAGALLAVIAPSLPVENLATRLHPGVAVADLRIDEILPELQDGGSLVLLIDRGDEATRESIARVNELVAMNPDSQVQVFGLAEEDEELATEFFWTAGPAFDVRGAPWGLIKPLYRTLPRTFLVRDGVVRRVWNEIPDEKTLEAIAAGEIP